MEKSEKLEELYIRSENLKVALQVIQFELQVVLDEIEELKTRKPIGFRLSKDRDETN